MPRRGRITLPGVPHHIIQRGNNRQACFYANQDYRRYLDWLGEYATLFACRIHAYVLMTNHVHLLLTPSNRGGVGQLMKRLGQRYVQYINRTYQRSGTLWEGRFRSCLVCDEAYVMSCYRYIELNPVRAAITRHPAEYRWSSYRVNAQGEASDLITPHELYLGLGLTAHQQQAKYRSMFFGGLTDELLREFRQATNGNYALGNDRFRRDVELALDRRASPGKSGRPATK